MTFCLSRTRMIHRRAMEGASLMKSEASGPAVQPDWQELGIMHLESPHCRQFLVAAAPLNVDPSSGLRQMNCSSERVPGFSTMRQAEPSELPLSLQVGNKLLACHMVVIQRIHDATALSAGASGSSGPSASAWSACSSGPSLSSSRASNSAAARFD